MFNYRWPILTATLLLLCFTLFVGYISKFETTRSGNEITFVCHVIENAADEEVQRALARALIFARSHEEALPALQAAASSTNEVIARAAQEAIRRRERERQARSV